MSNIIEGIKVIYFTGQVDLPDDPSYPYKLEVSLEAPDFMNVTFMLMHGSREEIVVRGMTKEALEEFVALNKLNTHPRLRELTITGPEAEEGK